MINKKLENKINKELIIPNIEFDKQSNDTTKWIKKLIEENKVILFYHSAKWKKVRQEVLQTFHNECVLCKLLNGKITTHDNRLKSGEYRGLQIHHMKEIEQYPEYGLEPIIIDPITGEKIVNLIPLCNYHHNAIHGKENNILKIKPQLNKERW